MATSETTVANLALSHIGNGKEIQDMDTEASTEAGACRRFFDIARDAMLREFPWPFATQIQALSLVETDPNDEWTYSYRYPADCLLLRRILSGTRKDTDTSKVQYVIGRDSTGLLIFTDQTDATAEYTMREDDVTRWPPDFVMALSYRLAAHIAPRVANGVPGMRELAIQFYQMSVATARGIAANEEQPGPPPDSEFITGRN